MIEEVVNQTIYEKINTFKERLKTLIDSIRLDGDKLILYENAVSGACPDIYNIIAGTVYEFDLDQEYRIVYNTLVQKFGLELLYDKWELVRTLKRDEVARDLGEGFVDMFEYIW